MKSIEDYCEKLRNKYPNTVIIQQISDDSFCLSDDDATIYQYLLNDKTKRQVLDNFYPYIKSVVIEKRKVYRLKTNLIDNNIPFIRFDINGEEIDSNEKLAKFNHYQNILEKAKAEQTKFLIPKDKNKNKKPKKNSNYFEIDPNSSLPTTRKARSGNGKRGKRSDY